MPNTTLEEDPPIRTSIDARLLEVSPSLAKEDGFRAEPARRTERRELKGDWHEEGSAER